MLPGEILTYIEFLLYLIEDFKELWVYDTRCCAERSNSGSKRIVHIAVPHKEKQLPDSEVLPSTTMLEYSSILLIEFNLSFFWIDDVTTIQELNGSIV